MTVYTELFVYRLNADGHVERHAGETPAIIKIEPVRVSIRTDTGRALALAAARRRTGAPMINRAEIIAQCEHCKRGFDAAHRNERFCSAWCRAPAQDEKALRRHLDEMLAGRKGKPVRAAVVSHVWPHGARVLLDVSFVCGSSAARLSGIFRDFESRLS